MIIGFGHQKQVGKDTAADAIKSLNPTEINIICLADPLYEICEMLVPDMMSRHYYNKFPEEKHEPLSMGKTPREILLSVGIGMRGILGGDCWANALMHKYSNSRVEKDMLVPDVRFKEEVDILKAAGAILIKVERPDNEYDRYVDTADEALKDWDGWDYTLVNGTDLQSFQLQAVRLYKFLQQSKGLR